jgi:hypothetical protein
MPKFQAKKSIPLTTSFSQFRSSIRLLGGYPGIPERESKPIREGMRQGRRYLFFFEKKGSTSTSRYDRQKGQGAENSIALEVARGRIGIE